MVSSCWSFSPHTDVRKHLLPACIPHLGPRFVYVPRIGVRDLVFGLDLLIPLEKVVNRVRITCFNSFCFDLAGLNSPDCWVTFLKCFVPVFSQIRIQSGKTQHLLRHRTGYRIARGFPHRPSARIHSVSMDSISGGVFCSSPCASWCDFAPFGRFCMVWRKNPVSPSHSANDVNSPLFHLFMALAICSGEDFIF